MFRYKTFNRKKSMYIFVGILFAMLVLMGRLVYLMIFCSEYYGKKAEDLHERERDIKAARGKILDANGVVLAANKTVCTISVIHNQIEDPEAVIAALTKELGISEEKVRARVEKVSSIERIKSNVEKETGERIRAYGLAGVKVDEDYKRYYPYDTLASKVLGFTGGDNQGIIGLEVKYDAYLQGTNGKILTLTDARGVEIENAGESRLDPVDGNHLQISLDYNIQMYAQQAAQKALEQKQADSVSIMVMNPSNGELMAMVNVPEFNLNDPFTLNYDAGNVSEEERQNLLNGMWRNQCINDTYEPGSTFKIITTTAALEEKVVSLSDQFFCPGYITVEDRRIHCHKRTGHGAEDFTHGIMNSCNPVFIDVGLRVGPERFYDYFGSLGLLKKTGIDLPGEAATIMHAKENIGLVELATMSFGQSFQITPVQLLTTVSSIINGGNRIIPHFGVSVQKDDGTVVKRFSYGGKNQIVSKETSDTVRYLLEQVVAEGGGKNAKIAGYSIGGKTATSQTLPRSANKYISSFLGFAPVENPQVIVLVIINNPQGIYYGGTIAAPVAREIFENILPYLGIPVDEKAAAESELAE
ncbi:MAG: peptidoglycan glycosyltransferase [Eubacterium sp.]|nr:peptidoglycan glycosyltransferase [Eubacterium sp.]